MKLGKLLLLNACLVSTAYADLGISLSAELGSDSNVTVDEIDLVTPTGDNYLELGVGGDVSHAFANASELDASYSYSTKRYNDFSQFDLDTHLFAAGYGLEWREIDFKFDVRHAMAQLDGSDFLDLTLYSPSMSFFITKQHFIRASITHINKSLDRRPERDAVANEYSVDYFYFVNGLNSYWIVGIKVRNENATDPVFDYTGTNYRVAYKFRTRVWQKDTEIEFDYRYRERDFDEQVNPDINAFRLDERHRLTASAQWSLTSDLVISVEASFRDNRSNLASLDFSEQVYLIALDYRFDLE